MEKELQRSNDDKNVEHLNYYWLYNRKDLFHLQLIIHLQQSKPFTFYSKHNRWGQIPLSSSAREEDK
jgi:hypothetical protein